MRFFVIVLFSFTAFYLFEPIKLKAQPVVIGQPADTSVCNGGFAKFYVLAVNTISYQWQENDGVGWYNIDETITYADGFTTPILSINDANLGLDGYLYRCIVTDGDNISAMSEGARLGVNEPPVVTIHPLDITVCKNSLALFSVNALNSDSYQWQESVGSGWIDMTENAFYSGVTEPNLKVFTTTGMNGFRYRCRVVNGNCPDTTNFARLFVNPTPTLQIVTGGGSFCEGGSGLPIGLADSEAGIAYHLSRNGTSTGIVVSGTGEAISLGTFTQAGNYTVRAINGSTGCAIPMHNSVQIIINPLPLQQSIMGGGSFCSGSLPPEIFLSSSQQNIVYTLHKNGLSTGQTLEGTGFTLSFGNISETGFYTVSARNISSNCAVQMNGNVQIIQNEIPQVFAGADQAIAPGTTAILSAQVSGAGLMPLLQWQPSAFVQQPHQATTTTIPLYQSRIFTVTAKNPISQCVSQADSIKVTITGGPLNLTLVADASSICPASVVNIIANAGGGTGQYSYSWTSTPVGFTATTAEISVSPTQTTTYQLALSDGNTTVNKSITISVYNIPIAQQVTGGGMFCSGESGLSVGLSGSQTGFLYSLFKDGQNLLSKQGTGTLLDFGSFTTAGEYTVSATSTTNSCTVAMIGSAVIQVNQKPTATAGPEQIIPSGGSAVLVGAATGGSGNYQYSWSPAALLINPTANSPSTIPLTATQQFHLSVTDALSGCVSNSAQTVVFVSGAPLLQADVTASSYTVCPSEEVQLTALAGGGSGSYTYQWQSNPSGFSSTVFNPKANPQQTTIYKVVITDGFLTASDSVKITVRPKPLAYQVAGGGTFCSGNAGPEVKLLNSEPSVFYSLLRNGTLTTEVRQGTGDPISFGQQSQSGIYQIDAFSPSNMCSASMTGQVVVTPLPKPIVDAGSDVTVAFNASTLLSATVSGGSGAYIGKWTPTSMVLDPNAFQSNSVPLTATTNFSFVATDTQNGCISDADVKTVFVSGSALSLQIETPSTSVCSGSSIILNALITGGTGSYSFYWTSNPEGFFGNTAQVTASPTVNTTYILSVNDGFQTISKSITINVLALPELFQITGGGNICSPGNKLPIGLSGSQTGTIYALMYENSTIANLVGTGSALAFGLFDAVGSYTVSAKKINNLCERLMEGTAVISNNGQVIADAGPDKYVVAGGQTVLEASVVAQQSNYTFSWSPAGKLLNPQAIQPTTTGLQATTLFKLTATSQGGGCQPSVDYVTVFVTSIPITVELISSSNVVCPGNDVQLLAVVSGGNGSYTYAWQSQPAGATSTLPNPVFSPTVPTTYTVTVHDGVQSVSQSVFVNTKNQPELFSLGGGGSFCQNTAVSLQLSGSETDVIYTLFRNNIVTSTQLNGTGSSLVFNAIQQDGFYTVIATAASQCSRMMTGEASVTFHIPPVIVSSPDQMIAGGSSTTLLSQTAGGSGSYTYQWQPSSMLTAPTSASTATVPLNNSTVFTVQAKDVQSGCFSNRDTTLVVVTGAALSVEILANNNVFCSGETLVLTALPQGGSGNYTYIWKNPAGAVIGTNAILSTAALLGGSYSLTLTDGLAIANKTIEIIIHPLPQLFNISGGGFLCQNAEGLSIELSGTQLDFEYSLTLNNDQVVAIQYGTGNAMVFEQIVQPGDYTVRAKNLLSSCGVMMNGNVQVNSTVPLVAVVSDFQYIQTGTAANLSVSASGGSGNFLYQWEPSQLVLNPNTANSATVPLSGNQTFSVTITDIRTGCQKSKQLYVIVSNNTLNVEIIAEQTLVCPGDSVRLFALTSGGQDNISYSWSSVPTGFQSTVFDPTVSPLLTTVYSVLVSDGLNSASKSIQINVKPSAQSFTVSGGGNVCSGGIGTEVNLSGSQLGVDYLLKRNGNLTGSVVSGTGQGISFENIITSGIYTIQGQNTSSNCVSNMNGSAQVDLFQRPVAYGGPDLTIASGEKANLEGFVTGGSNFYIYQWNPSYLVEQPNLISTLTLPLTQSTSFLFYASDQQSGCLSKVDTTLVMVTGQALNIQIIPEQAITCIGSSINFSILPGGGSGNYSYQWTDAAGNILGASQNLSYTVLSSQYLFAKLSDGDNFVSDSVFVEAVPLPEVFEVTGGGATCNSNIGIPIGLSQSEAGVIYTLFRNYTQALITVIGQGETIIFGNFSTSGVYTVMARKELLPCEIQMQGSAVIQVFTPPLVVAGPDQTIVQGSSATLESSVSNGSGNYAYSWQPADLLLNPTSAQPQTKNLFLSRVFTVTVTDVVSGCSTQDQTIVFVNGSGLSVILSATQTAVCRGNEVGFTAVPSGGSGNYTWLWTTSPATITGSEAYFNFTPNQNSKVKVTVSDGLNTVADSMIVTVLASPQTFNITGGGFWCSNATPPQVMLSGSQANVNYALFRNGITTGELFPGNGSPLSFNGTAANGNYTIVATNLSGCSAVMNGSVQVVQQPIPQRFNLIGGGAFCPGDAANGFLLSGSVIGTDYLLLLNGNELAGSYSGTGLPINITAPSVSGIYTVEAQQVASECSATMNGSANLIIYPLPEVAISGRNHICTGDTVVLTASGADTYLWMLNPTITTNQIEIAPTETTTYTLWGSNSFGCSQSSTFNVEVLPTPVFTLFDDRVNQTILVNGASIYPEYRFYSAGNLLSTSRFPSYFYGTTSFPSSTIVAEASNDLGCVSTQEITLNANAGEILINAFSPNGDNVNDRFLKGSFIKVYNRWGVELFSGNEGWDGTYKGNIVTPGTYYYLIEIMDINGVLVRTEKGSVTIIIR